MTIANVQIANTVDSCFAGSDNSTYTGLVKFGYFFGTYDRMFLRFQGVGVPSGSNVSSATLINYITAGGTAGTSVGK
uniref:hypothetical protein n=1 Tax=Companilactobacillus sp. TaxID=2767905 RepID=UPI002618E96B